MCINFFNLTYLKPIREPIFLISYTYILTFKYPINNLRYI